MKNQDHNHGRYKQTQNNNSVNLKSNKLELNQISATLLLFLNY